MVCIFALRCSLHYIFYLTDTSQRSTLTLRAYLAGLLPGSVSSSSGGVLPNVFLEELFSVKSRGAGAVLYEPQIVVAPKQF
jgi:hypothetical protein